MNFSSGKLPAGFFESLLLGEQNFDKSVVLGPGTGIDCAVLDVGENYLVVKSDPITFATNQIGWYAVNVNANDIVTTGATPKWFMATILFPENQTNEELVKLIFAQIQDACEKINVNLVGGHTEVTIGIDRPIISGTMLGIVEKDKLIRQDGIKVGDVVLMTKGAPIEGISILAHEFENELKEKFSKDEINFAKNFLHTPGISVYPEAMAIRNIQGIHAMHDPTEGGMMTAIWEIAQASKKRISINSEAIFVPEIGEKLCKHFGLDPYRTIASGSLLIFCDAKSVGDIKYSLSLKDIDCFEIGIVENGDAKLIVDGELYTKEFRDEINKVF